MFKFLAKNFKAILRIAITALACGGPQAAALCIPVTVGTSFAFTLADGGSLSDALKAAAFSAASAGIFSGVGDILTDIALTGIAHTVVKSAVHGVVGGALSVAQGGSFLHGFAANAIGAAAGSVTGNTGLANANNEAGVMIRTFVAGSAGGLAASLTGGKFENGFLTAATAHLFNNERVFPMFLGSDADQTLRNHLMSGEQGDKWVGNVSLAGIFGLGPRGGKLRPDLIYDNYEVFETKIFGQEAAGARELNQYIENTGGRYRLGDLARIFGASYEPLPLRSTGWFGMIARSIGIDIVYTFSPSQHLGVVVFTTERDPSELYQTLIDAAPKGTGVLPWDRPMRRGRRGF